MKAVISIEELQDIKKEVNDVFVSPALKSYIVSLIDITRNPAKYESELKKYIDFGASPRATLALFKASKALAYINGEEFVKPSHIQKILPNILRHRLILNYNAKAENISKDEVIKQIIAQVAY